MDEKKRVLIVDDEKNIVNILKFNLQKEGYDTLEAYDGEAGLQLALQENPDLILLDVMLPKMIGWDVCKKLREAGSNIPVIILTAREEEEDKVLGLEIGADDYITKPFSTRELMARVKANIRRSAMLVSSAAAPGSGLLKRRRVPKCVEPIQEDPIMGIFFCQLPNLIRIQAVEKTDNGGPFTVFHIVKHPGKSRQPFICAGKAAIGPCYGEMVLFRFIQQENTEPDQQHALHLCFTKR